MAVASTDEGKKWIQTSVALSCILLGYVLISFFEKMAEWFALETVIPYFYVVTQIVSVVTSLAVYLVTMRQENGPPNGGP